MQSNSKILGIIPARFASTRFPAKMLAPIDGKTLIQRTYENAKLCSNLSDVVIATDDQRIYDHAKDFGAPVVMTCLSCLTGTDRLADALRKNPHLKEAEIIINIQGDEPCINPNIIQRVSEVLLEDSTAVMSTAVSQLKTIEEANNPSIPKCVLDRNHNALYFSRALIPSGHKLTFRPEIPYYRHIGIYGYRRDFLMQYGELPPTPLQLAEDLEQLKVLENGFRIKVAIVDYFNMEVNNPEDIQKVEQWLCKLNTSSSQAAFARR
jgi:3-deoxy-manno-octulosonate cytidylyltransferase (CMP-KDO synthetase)